MSYNSKKKRNVKRKKLTKVNLINKPLKKTIKLVKRQKSTKLGLNKKPRKKSVKNRYGSKKKLIGGNNDCSFLKCIDNPDIFFNSDTSIENVLNGIDVSETQFLYAKPKSEKINIIETIFSQLKFSPETEIGCGIIEKSKFPKDIITALIYGRDLLLGIHTILKKIEKETGGDEVRGGKKTKGFFRKGSNNKCDENSLQLKRTDLNLLKKKIGIETSKIHLCYNCNFIFDNEAKKFKLVITGYKYKDSKETKKPIEIEIYHDDIVNDPELIKKSESESESENELKFTLKPKSKFLNKTFKFENTNIDSGHIKYLKKLLECLKHLGEIIDGDKSIKTFLKVSEEYIHFIDRKIFPSDPSSFLIEFLNKTNIVQLFNTDSDSDSDVNSDFSKFIEDLRDKDKDNDNEENNKKFFECRYGKTPLSAAAPEVVSITRPLQLNPSLASAPARPLPPPAANRHGAQAAAPPDASDRRPPLGLRPHHAPPPKKIPAAFAREGTREEAIMKLRKDFGYDADDDFETNIQTELNGFIGPKNSKQFCELAFSNDADPANIDALYNILDVHRRNFPKDHELVASVSENIKNQKIRSKEDAIKYLIEAGEEMGDIVKKDEQYVSEA